MEEKKKKAGIWALVGKVGSKTLSVFVKALKGLKLTKIGLAGASFAGYAAMYSWKFALLLMVAVGFHESGHVWAMKKVGLKTKGFYFLPFIGGAAISEDKYKSYAENAYVSMMGPIWGAGLAFLSAVTYWFTGNPLWAAAAAWMSTLNIFNLLPIHPLDGGQLMRCLCLSFNKWVSVVFLLLSSVLAGIVLFKLKIYLFVIILIVGLIELYFEVRHKIKYNNGEYVPYYIVSKLQNSPLNLTSKQMLQYGGLYAGLIAFLVFILQMMKHVPGADLAANFLE